MKKIISILLLISIIITLIGCGSENGKVEETEETKEVAVEKIDYSAWDDMKENIVGKSDKDFLELTKSKPTNVRNDATEKWKKSTISENVNLEEYLLSYTNLYMEEGDVHFVINFNYNTTTRVNYSGGLINSTIMEYERKEEHDASKIGKGMLLKEYIIYPDGDIEEIGD